ncbi:YkyA family protein [Peribacillus alkalitolerans]|uniref:YkyA family protein n=1 Tax=Peribacillus alkalitolerans TaxID=1550385 RepID=UPI0013D376A4|nr:YkyA family protein [Peribacillus alkalitolerans]
MFKARHLSIVLLLVITFTISGCLNKTSPEENLLTLLENIVKNEKVFEKQQVPLTKLEEQEKVLYDKIIQLGMKEFDQIVKLSDEAIVNANKREEAMKKERESIQSSEEEFKKIDSIIKEIEDKETKKQAKELKKLMETRYAAHEQLFDSYMESIQKDITVYEQFKKEDLTLEELQKHIDEVNASYDEVMKTNDIYNKATDEYNREKMTFYKQAGLKVKVEE